MARVTVEDCKKIIPNHFELVVLASRRARDISTGSPILVERSNDKNAVIALREMAAQKLNIDSLRDGTVQDFRKSRYNDDDANEAAQESYIELEEEGSKFLQGFGAEMENESDLAVDEDDFLDQDMSFEDVDLDEEN